MAVHLTLNVTNKHEPNFLHFFTHLVADLEVKEVGFVVKWMWRKDGLCWEYQDVVNFKLNSRNQKFVTNLSTEAHQSLKGNEQNNSIMIIVSKKMR